MTGRRLGLGEAGFSVFVFGIYLLALGATLLVAPNALLGLFRLPATEDVWIRVVGMLVLYLGAYYIVAALAEQRAFMQATVPLRAGVILFFGAFVFIGLAPPMLILFGVVDLIGAGWTAWALRRQARD